MKSAQHGLINSRICGHVAAPPSKSMMQRAVAIACLAKTPTLIKSPSFSDDGFAALRIAECLGAQVAIAKDEVTIAPQPFVSKTVQLNCSESGLSFRMFSAVAALSDTEVTLTGRGSLLTRPLSMIEGPLRALGAEVSSNNGFPPLKLRGPLKGGRLEVDGSLSSQFITGLLIALPRCANDSQLYVQNLKSKPYIRMTLELLRLFNAQIEVNSDLSEFYIPGNQSFYRKDYTVEGDWSGAAFLLVAGAIAGNVTVTNLRRDSAQADRAVIEALKRSGALVDMTESAVSVKRPVPGALLKAFEFDATDCPDLFPPLVTLAAAALGETKIIGATRLRHKESDRAHSLVTEFSKLGVKISVDADVMRVVGIGQDLLSGGHVSSHNDHRIAMALATAELCAKDKITISNPDCINKSFPDFYEVLQSVRVQ